MYTSLDSKKELLATIKRRIAETEHLIGWVEFSLKAPDQFTNLAIQAKRKQLLQNLRLEVTDFTRYENEVRTDIEYIETKEALQAMGQRFSSNGRVFYLLP